MAKTKTATATTATPKPATAKRGNTKPATATASPIDVLVAWARTITPANVLTSVATLIAGNTAVRNIGRVTGMRVMAFQNHTLIHNATWQLNDLQIAAMWATEFPRNVGRVFSMNGIERPATASSVADGVSIVRGVRSDFNRTGHGEPTGKPATPSVAYGETRFVIPAETVAVESAKPAKPARTPKTKTA